jgi:hypothetical protein
LTKKLAARVGERIAGQDYLSRNATEAPLVPVIFDEYATARSAHRRSLSG